MIGSLLRMRKEGEEFDFQKNTNKAYWQSSIFNVNEFMPKFAGETDANIIIDDPTYPTFDLEKLNECDMNRDVVTVDDTVSLPASSIVTELSSKTNKYLFSSQLIRAFTEEQENGAYRYKVAFNEDEIYYSEPYYKNLSVPNELTGAFVFTITGDSFVLPTVSGETYNATVNWGDGNTSTVTAYDDAGISHTYSESGTYQIYIKGKFGGWLLSGTASAPKFISVDQWGDIDIDEIVSGFANCVNLVSLPASGSIPVTTSCTSAVTVFANTTNLTTLSTGIFDKMVNVTNFSSCFYQSGITGFPVDLFRYCVEATDFRFLAYNIPAFTTLPADIFRYNTKATTFREAFLLAGLTSLPEDLFYYNKLVTTYHQTFDNCQGFALPARIFDLSVLNIVTSFVQFMQSVHSSQHHTGNIQDIWNYSAATSINAFQDQTDITNYAAIPAGWK